MGTILKFVLITGILNLAGSLHAVEFSGQKKESGKYSLSAHLSFFIDGSGIVEFRDIIKKEREFVRNSKSIPSFGFTRAAIWGRIDLTSLPWKSGTRTIQLDFPLFEFIDFYIPEKGPLEEVQYRNIKAGLAGSGEVSALNPGIDIMIDLEETVSRPVYFRIQTFNDPVVVQLAMSSPEDAVRHSHSKSLFHGGYYGIFLVMLMYNLFIYLTVRDKSYLYYSFYVLANAISLACIHGRISALIEDHNLYRVILVVSIHSATIFGIVFARNFLMTRKYSTWLHKILGIYIGLYLVNAVMGMFLDYYPMIIYFVLLASGSTLLFISGFKLYREHQYARYYTHAWALYLASLVLYTLRSWGISLPFSAYALEVGGVVEVLLLSFALASRIRAMQEESRNYQLLQRDLEMAAETQRYLFPQNLPVQDSCTFAARYLPSNSISGDFYDIYKDSSCNIYVILVDVAGHGYAAGLVASMVKVAFHETADAQKSVRDHQIEINRILKTIVKNNFATALNLRILPDEKKLSLVRSGHTPLWHFKRRENILETYKPDGLPLAIVSDYRCEQMDIHYEKGDRLFLYTDGVIEERDIKQKEYGEPRLRRLFLESIDIPVENFADRLLNDVRNAKGTEPQEDDITFIVIDLH